ncbi:Uncharacterised protein [Mycobacteroides abscessus subsp. abscessus]|nr:Uncharacterised protein [Mycobacteroides abscessus subsp. abscessus]
MFDIRPISVSSRPRAICLRICRSAARRVRIAGRCIFTTTAVPSFNVALCTWAIDADANGTSSNEPNTFSGDAPSSLVTMERIV